MQGGKLLISSKGQKVSNEDSKAFRWGSDLPQPLIYFKSLIEVFEVLFHFSTFPVGLVTG